MKHFRTHVLLLLSLFTVSQLMGQGPQLIRVDSVNIISNGFPLHNPWAGGLDLPQFSQADLNYDGIADLYIYDRAAFQSYVFLYTGGGSTPEYTYSPEISATFPKDISNWALLRDFNCDGSPDLFTCSRKNNLYVEVWQNVGTGGVNSFVSINDSLLSDYKGTIGTEGLFVAFTDVPAIEDIDGDGDLDFLTFDGGGNSVELHQNMSFENNSTCGLEFERMDACWGNFQESAFGEEINLNISCRMAQGGPRHAGSTVTVFDEDGDGDLDLLLGDLIVNQVTFLRNSGTTMNAFMDTTYLGFPAYDSPINLNKFVGTYIIDVDLDGRSDLIAAPNEPGAYTNIQNVVYYQNLDQNGGTRFSQTTSRFLQNTMVDVGNISKPAFFDYNNDGLLDLVVGNFTRLVTDQFPESQLTLFENTGTATAPEFTLVDEDWQNISGSFSIPVYGFAPTFADMDNDGDQDMVIGGDQGELHYFENTASAGQNASFTLSQADWFSIDVGNFATPELVDLDRDGDFDLVIGEMEGNLNFYRNTGTASAPDFPSQPTDDNFGLVDVQPICCVGNSTPFIYEDPTTNKYNLVSGSTDGWIFLYEDIESQSSGVFPLTTDRLGNINQGLNSAVAAADLNGDGKLEWVVGNKRGGLALYSETGSVSRPEITPTQLAVVDIFPNPSQGQLTVHLVDRVGKRLSVQFLDSQGRLVAAQDAPVGNGYVEIMTKELATGLYHLRFELDGEYIGAKKWILTE